MSSDLISIREAIEDNAGRPTLPVQFPPFGQAFFQDFLRTFSVPAGSAMTTFEQFEMPPDRIGIVRFLGIEANNPAALADVRFRILLNRSVHHNYQAPPVLLGTIDEPATVYIPLTQQNLFELQMSNTGAGAYDIFVRLTVWWWSALLDPSRGSVR